jgi:hypothetical protein
MSSPIFHKVDLSYLVNPFFIYCISFTLAIIAYYWGWSEIYPKLSVILILFFVLTFIVFTIAGIFFRKVYSKIGFSQAVPDQLNDIMFWVIMLLGLTNVLLMGYLPILHREYNYREFGVHIVDTLSNTLAIFFSVNFLYSYINGKKKRYLIYFFIIIVFQLLLFRRSTIVWILVSSLFLLIYNYKRISVVLIIIFFLSVPLFSWCFGQYGNYRSKLSKAFVVYDLRAGDIFKNKILSHNHYITYLYVTSPLANLQTNIDLGKGFFNKGDFKRFAMYCVIPESITLRMQDRLELFPPETRLIHNELIVGTFLMISYITMGWFGMIFMIVLLFGTILLCLYLSTRWNIFQITTFSILSTSVSLLIFANVLNRLDTLLMLFLYPILFHFIYRNKSQFIPGTI